MQQISDKFERLHVQQPSDDAASLGCVTLDAIDVTPNSATLIGAPLGPRDKEWFDFDFAGKGKMRYSISVVRRADHEHPTGSKATDIYAVKRTNVVGAVQGTAPSLQPGTTYRFRYVAQHDGITCFGDTITFTTPKK